MKLKNSIYHVSFRFSLRLWTFFLLFDCGIDKQNILIMAWVKKGVKGELSYNGSLVAMASLTSSCKTTSCFPLSRRHFTCLVCFSYRRNLMQMNCTSALSAWSHKVCRGYIIPRSRELKVPPNDSSSWAFQIGVKKLGRVQEETIKLN